VSAGKLHFDRALMHGEEFLKDSSTFEYFDVAQQWQTIELEPDSLAYTVCQVPVVHKKGAIEQIQVKMNDGKVHTVEGLSLSRDLSTMIFNRSHSVRQLTVFA